MSKRDPFAKFDVTKKTQLTTTSNQLYDDTKFLYKEGQRYAAALYLGGFVIECLLKAALWKRRQEKPIRRLLFTHDLHKLLEMNTSLAKALRADRQGLYQQFVRLSTWNVRFRYNPKNIPKSDADDFMRRLKEVRQWLIQKV